MQYAQIPASVLGQPRPDALAAIDSALQTIEASTVDFVPSARTYHKHHRSRLASDLSLIQGANSGRILEVGAYPCLLTVALASGGHDVEAVDFNAERLAPLGISIASCDIETTPLPFADEAFGTVILNEVFEHLRIDLVFTCRELLRVLRPGGVLHFSTPNLRSLRGLKSLVKDGRGAWCLPHLYDNWSRLASVGAGHVREYTPRDVTEFLDRVGFDCERLIFRGGAGSPAERLALKLFPRWTPYFSVVARKPVKAA